MYVVVVNEGMHVYAMVVNDGTNQVMVVCSGRG